MKSIFSQAYYWPYKDKTYSISHCMAVGFFTFSLCYWVRPFDLDEYISGDLFLNMSIATATSNMLVVGFVNIFGVPFLIPKHFVRWTIGKEVFWTMFVIIIACIIGPFMMETFFRKGEFFNVTHYLNMVTWALVGSIVPLIFSVLINHMRIQLIRSNEIKASLGQTEEKEQENGLVVVIPTEKGEYLLNLDRLIVIKSNANYLEIYFTAPKSTHQQDKIRCTLTAMEKVIGQYGNLLRCHRAYILNLDKVDGYTGCLSNGFEVVNHSLDFLVPVSRTKSKEFSVNPHLPQGLNS